MLSVGQLRITMVQMDIEWENPALNREKVSNIVSSLKGITDLILFPETFTTGFSTKSVHLAEPMDVPTNWVRREWRGTYKGQKQIWFLLRLTGRDSDVSLRRTSHPEFDAWRWSEYWSPLDSVIEFKRKVYEAALSELTRFLEGLPTRPPRCNGSPRN